MITNRQKYFIITYISQALFLGVGYSLIVNYTNNDSWICFILGTILGILFCIAINKILDYKKDKDLTNILKNNKFLNYIIRFLLIILAIIIINEVYFIVEEFAKSFFLTNTTTFCVLLPLLILAIYMSFKGYKLFSYVSECLFPIGLVLLSFAFISLVFKIDISNIKPFFSHTTGSFIKSTLHYFILSTSPLIFLLDMNFENNKITSSYIISSIVLLIMCLLLIFILGRFLIIIYRFPEYMILKEISLFNFIEKIENVIAIAWIIDEFSLLCLASIFLKRMLPKKNNSYVFITIMVSIFILACTILSKNHIKDLYMYLYFPYILGSIAFIIIISLFIYVKHKTNFQV